ncbi:MAG: hypothetical protein ACXWOV_17780, partial [Isosphaeraceae bacterium]
GFEGAGNFYREIDRLVNTRIWKMITPPWLEKKNGESGPPLEARGPHHHPAHLSRLALEDE